MAGPGGTDSLTRASYLSVSAPQSPEAGFSGTPRSGAVPLTVSFTDLSSGAPTSWLWSFGDGDTSSARNPVHVYDQPGTYTVRLDVTGPGGSDSLTRSNYVSVSSPVPTAPPVAGFSATPLSGPAPLTVSSSRTSRSPVALSSSFAPVSVS